MSKEKTATKLESTVKTHIPGWGKIGLKLLISRLPFNYSTWHMLGVFLHGKMDGVSYVKDVFEAHLAMMGLTGDDLRGKTILEIGPGDSSI